MKIKIDFRNFWGNFKQQAKNAGGLKRSFIQILSEDGYEFVLDEENPHMIVFLMSYLILHRINCKI